MKYLNLLLCVLLVSLISCSGDRKSRMEYSTMLTDWTEVFNDNLKSVNDTISLNLMRRGYQDVEKINELTDEIFSTTSNFKNELIEKCGGRSEYYSLNNPYEEEKVAEYFINEGNSEKLKESVNRMTLFLNESGIDARKIIFEPNEISVFAAAPNSSEMTFARIYFRGSNITETLHFLTVLESFVLQAENKFLTYKLLNINS